MITTEELIRGFSEENFGAWCRGQFSDFVPKPADLDAGDFVRARQLGYVRTLAEGGVNRPLLVAAVQVEGELGERSSRKRQFDFARKALQRAAESPPGTFKGVMTQGLFVFYGDGGDFRVSLVSVRIEGGKPVYNSFKRQTFFVRQDQANRTFRDQMEKGIGDYKALCDAFSVEALTKQFYNELFKWYSWALSDEMDVRFPNDIHTDKDNREMIPEHVIRLITRLMFVWFIKLKRLVPDEIFEVEELRNLLKDFDPASATEGNYYNAILQNLFFATLNNEIKDRAFATNGTTNKENEEHYGVKTLFRNPVDDTWFKVPDDAILKLFETVPFLNGGLFECLDRPKDEKSKKILYYDGFSREKKYRGHLTRAHVPNGLFFDEERGLIPLFRRYNFTVEENSPSDAEVALDPELLGKVFENLLGAYNPETQKTARKESGSFYTPREIVGYMVDESLKQYLKTKVKIDDAALALLFDEEAPMDLPPAIRTDLVAAIRSVKIIDLACGSGAFPMGALHRLVDLLVKLEGEPENLYDLKLHLIQNCIYGVDIQTIAVQISKLRFFISLVCEQEPNEDKGDNYGIRPLPNLETKFVAANSLIGLEKEMGDGLNLGDEEIARLREELKEVRHRHFSSKSSADKQKLRKKDKELRQNIEKRIVSIASTPNLDKIADLETQIRKLEAEKTKFEGEKWVEKAESFLLCEEGHVEPVVRTDENKAQRKRIQADIDRKKREIDDEKRKKATDALLEEAEKLAAWNPYDQNASSPFFDPEWMFGMEVGFDVTIGNLRNPGGGRSVRMEVGFDVTIGNPPYVRADEQSEWNQAQCRAIMKSGQYETLWEKWDLFVPFIERAYKLLKPNGVTSLIVSDAFCHSKYAQKSQEWFLRNASVLRLDFCSDLQIFEAAVHNLIYLFQKADGLHTTPLRRRHDCRFGAVSLLPSEEQNKLTCRIFFPEDRVAQQFFAHTSKLSEICYVSVGMVTNAHENLAQGAFELKDLLSPDRDKKHPKRFVEGKDIDKWIPSSHKWIEWGTARAPALFRRKTFVELYEQAEKLLLVKVGAVRAGYDNEQQYCNEGIYVSIPWHMLSGIRNNSLKKAARYQNEKPTRPDLPKREELEKTSRHFSIKYLLAVLNSSFANDFLRANRRNNVQLYPEDWKKLPIPDVPKEKQEPIVRLVDRILAAKRKDLKADVSELESEIDKKVYELYGMKAPDPAEAKAASAPVVSKGRDNKPEASRTAKSKSVLVDDEGLD
jgi:adenine-specific DNA-methyltransferase